MDRGLQCLLVDQGQGFKQHVELQGSWSPATLEDRKMYLEIVLLCWIYFYLIVYQLLFKAKLLELLQFMKNVCGLKKFS